MWKSSSPEHDSSSPAARPPALPEKCVPDYASLRKCRNSRRRLLTAAARSRAWPEGRLAIRFAIGPQLNKPPHSFQGAHLKRQQIPLQLLVALFFRPNIQRDAGDFIHHRDSQAVLRQVDSLDVGAASIARLDPDIVEFGR
jgi:hypothetical protein